MTTRIATAAVAVFVVVVIVLWVRHRAALSKRDTELASVVIAARLDDATRIAALHDAKQRPMPSEPRACPHTARVRVVRLDKIDDPGGSVRDVIAAVANQREPKPWPHELDVVEGRAFLYDYDAGAVLCVGTDAEDPHGTLVAY